MKYRISTFWKMDRISDNHILLVVWNRKFNFKHKNDKVIHMLYFCYKKLLIREYVDFWNKQLWSEIVWYLEKIWFIIPYNKWNKISSMNEIQMVDQILHNELWVFEPTTNDLELQLLKQKSEERETYKVKNDIIKSHFLDFLMQRRSEREFIWNDLSKKKLLTILQSWLLSNKEKGELTFHWVTPSAWCFYEIEAYIFVFKDLDDLQKWIYMYNKYSNEIEKTEFINEYDIFLPWIKDHFNWINCLIVFVWNLDYITQKYGHKSYLYQSIEVGMIQQNMILYAQQNNIWTCVLWWYNNNSIRNNLKLPIEKSIYSTLLL